MVIVVLVFLFLSGFVVGALTMRRRCSKEVKKLKKQFLEYRTVAEGMKSPPPGSDYISQNKAQEAVRERIAQIEVLGVNAKTGQPYGFIEALRKGTFIHPALKDVLRVVSIAHPEIRFSYAQLEEFVGAFRMKFPGTDVSAHDTNLIENILKAFYAFARERPEGTDPFEILKMVKKIIGDFDSSKEEEALGAVPLSEKELFLAEIEKAIEEMKKEGSLKSILQIIDMLDKSFGEWNQVFDPEPIQEALDLIFNKLSGNVSDLAREVIRRATKVREKLNEIKNLIPKEEDLTGSITCSVCQAPIGAGSSQTGQCESCGADLSSPPPEPPKEEPPSPEVKPSTGMALVIEDLDTLDATAETPAKEVPQPTKTIKEEVLVAAFQSGEKEGLLEHVKKMAAADDCDPIFIRSDLVSINILLALLRDQSEDPEEYLIKSQIGKLASKKEAILAGMIAG